MKHRVISFTNVVDFNEKEFWERQLYFTKRHIIMTEEKSIHDIDDSLICEYFSAFERQGPGSPEMTVKVLSFSDHLSDDAQIADLDCVRGQAVETNGALIIKYSAHCHKNNL